MSYGPPLLRAAYRAAFPLGGSLAATAYGLLTRRRKFGARFHARLAELRRLEWMDTGEMLERSAAAAVAFAERARQTVPAHRERLAAALGSRFQVRHPDDLAALPLLSKDEVRANLQAFLPEGAARRRSLVTHTSGTTGSALTVHLSPEAYQDEYAFTWLHRGQMGLDPGARTATFAGHPVVPAERRRPPFWVENRSDNQILFSSYHLSPATLPDYVERLRRFRPALIHGYPSSLAQVARAVVEAGVDDIQPRGIFPASETLLAGQRELLAAAFACPVLGWYGNTELAGHATQCPAGRIHVQHAHSYLEVVDATGRPLPPGEHGEIVGTNFLNDAMPLLRYRTGDGAVLAEGPCPCHRSGLILASISGRMDDVVTTPDGRRIGRLDHLFKETTGIREAQVHQTGADTLVLRVVPEPGGAPGWRRILLAEARQRLGPEMRLTIEEVDAIPRGPGGKFRPVISDLTGPPGETP